MSQGWYLNDKRYKEYTGNTSKVLNKILPKITSMLQWNTYSPEIKRMILSEVVGRVKKEVRSQIVREANINDIEKLQ